MALHAKGVYQKRSNLGSDYGPESQKEVSHLVDLSEWNYTREPYNCETNSELTQLMKSKQLLKSPGKWRKTYTNIESLWLCERNQGLDYRGLSPSLSRSKPQ